MKLVAISGVLSAFVLLAACTPEEVAKTCAIAKIAHDSDRGGAAEKQWVAEARVWCAARGHVF